MGIKIVNLKKEIKMNIKHLFRRLLESPLLSVWIVASIIVSAIFGGYNAFFVTIVNLIILSLFTIIIKTITDREKVKIVNRITYPKLELFIGILLFFFIVMEIGVFFKVTNVPYIGSIIRNVQTTIKEYVYRFANVGFSAWILSLIYEIAIYLSIFFIPIIIILIVCIFNFKSMGFVLGNVKLIVILLTIAIVLGIPNKVLISQPFNMIITAYIASIFSNAICEEFFFRGFLLPRLEDILKNPINALIISAIAFNISHIPSYLNQGMNFYKIGLYCFSVNYPTGLLFGYLYLKTRSIIPSVILHASNTILGLVFISSVLR